MRLALLAFALLAAAFTVWHTARAPIPAADPAAQIASSLRCPDCQAVSAAESRSELAVAMRTEIGRQLAAGRTHDEIRSFFQQRYGDWILLSPPAEGASLAVWLLPPAATAALAIALKRRRSAPVRHPRPVRLGLAGLAVTAVAAGGLVAVLGSAGHAPTAAEHLARGRALQAAGDLEGAVRAFRAAADLGDHSAAYLLGFALVKAGRPAEAVALLRPLAGRSPADAELLLVLGTAEYALDADRGRAALRRFLDVAPAGHPAREQVRRLAAKP